MKLEESGLEELNSNELNEIHGGFWPAFFAGYVLGEILEGIQRGVSKPCTNQC